MYAFVAVAFSRIRIRLWSKKCKESIKDVCTRGEIVLLVSLVAFMIVTVIIISYYVDGTT